MFPCVCLMQGCWYCQLLSFRLKMRNPWPFGHQLICRIHWISLTISQKKFFVNLWHKWKRKPGYCNAEVGGGRAGVSFCFRLNNFNLLWPIDNKLAVWVAYIKRQLGIATKVSVIKVKVTVTKNGNSVSAQ